MSRALLSLVLIGAVGAGVYWQQSRNRLESELAPGEAAVGTRSGQAIIESLGKRFPDNAHVQFLRARQLAYDGKYALAEDCLNRAARLGWPKAEVERQRRIVLSRSDFRKAEPQLLELLDSHANDREVILALADGYNRYKLPQKAEPLLDRVLQTDPDDGTALMLRGEARMVFLAADKALGDLEKSYAQSQELYYHYRIQFLLANCLRTLGQIERAFELYRQCCEESPADVVARYDLGLCAHYLGRSGEAMAAFDEVLRLKPNDIEALLQVAYLHDEGGELGKALQVLQRIEAAYPDEPQMLVQMAKTYQAQGNLAEAAKYHKRSEELHRQWEERAVKERQKSASEAQGRQ